MCSVVYFEAGGVDTVDIPAGSYRELRGGEMRMPGSGGP